VKHLLKVTYLLLLITILFVSNLIGRWGANLFDYTIFDPDGAFLWISVHHIVQAIFIIILIVVVQKLLNINFNLGMGNQKIGFGYLKKFMFFFGIYTVGAFLSMIIFGALQPFQYALTGKNIAGYLSFQLLLSGPSEEIIYRAFAITMFGFLITSKRINRHISYANVFAAIFFGIAHISFSFNPFAVSYSLFQVVYAMVLGYFYGDCYEKSKSVIYPMIMHSFTNVVMVGLTVILSFFL
jgi:membrane protease YdiL (CAAX protease family)